MSTNAERLDNIEDRLRDVEAGQVRIETTVTVGFEHTNETLSELKQGLLGNGQPGLRDDVAVLKQESKHCEDHRKDERKHMSLENLLRYNRMARTVSMGGGTLGFGSFIIMLLKALKWI